MPPTIRELRSTCSKSTEWSASGAGTAERQFNNREKNNDRALSLVFKTKSFTHDGSNFNLLEILIYLGSISYRVNVESNLV